VQVNLLGPVEVVGSDGVPLSLSPTQQVLVSVLALRSPHIVQTDHLVETLWSTDPPASPYTVLRNHVKRLRKRLGPELAQTVRSGTSGYWLAVDRSTVDAFAFGDAYDAGSAALAAGKTSEAAAALGWALGLWRGPALGAINSPALDPDRRRLEASRVEAIKMNLELQLGFGRHRQVAAELVELQRLYPFDERLGALAMAALERCGRRSEALGVYADLRLGLSRTLGIAPAASTQRDFEAILRGEPV